MSAEEDRVASVEIVIGKARVHLAPSYHKEPSAGYWPHFMLREYWNLEETQVIAISKVINQVYDDLNADESYWKNPIVCVAAAVALFLEHWQAYGEFVKDGGEEKKN